MKSSAADTEESFSWQDNFASFCESPIKIIEPSELDDKHPARMFEQYWHSLADGAVPDRSSFAPSHAKYALKWLMLFKKDTSSEKPRFQLSLLGTSAREMAIHARQGQYLDEFTANDCYSSREKLMKAVFKRKCPGFARIEVTPHSEFRTTVTTGMFPFRDKSGDQVFVIPAPENKAIRALL